MKEHFYFTANGREYKARYDEFYNKYWVENLVTGYLFSVDEEVFNEYYHPKSNGSAT